MFDSPPTMKVFLVHQPFAEVIVVEREYVHFTDGWVIFANGPMDSIRTHVLAYASKPGMRVEEITDMPTSLEMYRKKKEEENVSGT